MRQSSEAPVDNARLWDDGCASDPVRNDFIVPKLVELVHKLSPSSVLDVGCGTGYISSQVANAANPDINWTLVDMNSERLIIAEERFREIRNVELIGSDIFDETTHNLGADWVLVCNSILEFELDDKQARRVSDLVHLGGHLLLAVPDTLTDVINSDEIPSEYLTQAVSLDKIDKFTGEPYPFFAHRAVNLICVFVALGLHLVEVSRSAVGGGHFLFVFHRQGDA